jgi:hypothetical protein
VQVVIVEVKAVAVVVPAVTVAVTVLVILVPEFRLKSMLTMRRTDLLVIVPVVILFVDVEVNFVRVVVPSLHVS